MLSLYQAAGCAGLSRRAEHPGGPLWFLRHASDGKATARVEAVVLDEQAGAGSLGRHGERDGRIQTAHILMSRRPGGSDRGRIRRRRHDRLVLVDHRTLKHPEQMTR
jgi:hypothetical protein